MNKTSWLCIKGLQQPGVHLIKQNKPVCNAGTKGNMMHCDSCVIYKLLLLFLIKGKKNCMTMLRDREKEALKQNLSASVPNIGKLIRVSSSNDSC